MLLALESFNVSVEEEKARPQMKPNLLVLLALEERDKLLQRPVRVPQVVHPQDLAGPLAEVDVRPAVDRDARHAPVADWPASLEMKRQTRVTRRVKTRLEKEKKWGRAMLLGT